MRTQQDVVTSLRDKLCVNAEEYFSLVLEHVKSLKRNKLTVLDPQETLARVSDDDDDDFFFLFFYDGSRQLPTDANSSVYIFI